MDVLWGGNVIGSVGGGGCVIILGRLVSLINNSKADDNFLLLLPFIIIKGTAIKIREKKKKDEKIFKIIENAHKEINVNN